MRLIQTILIMLECFQFTVDVVPEFTVTVIEQETAVPVVQETIIQQQFLVSEPWCAACPAARRQFRANGWPEKNIINNAECRRRFGWSAPHFPYLFWGDVKVTVPVAAAVQDGPLPIEDRPLAIQYGDPPEVVTASTPQPNVVKSVQKINTSPPSRYINWPGWGRIDLETYNRNCNCGMCRSIRARQQEYRRQLNEYNRTSSLTDDKQPCPIAVVDQMLDLMRLNRNDILADLGCGDGRILIAAARRGIRGIGVELDESRAEVARQAVRNAGLSHLITIETGDARQFDASRASAITAYLYPTLLEELAPKLKSVRVAASPFHEVPGLTMVQHGDVWIHKADI